MALVLAMLAASLARGDEIAPDAATALVLEPPPPLSIDRYRSGRNLATTGLVLVPVGFGVGIGGLVVALSAQTEEVYLLGIGASLAGGAAMMVGPPLTIIGSLKSARALERAGIHVTTTWAVVSVVLYVGGWVFPPAYLGSVITGALQVSANQHALRAWGEKGSVTILPWTVDGTHGLALAGSF